MRFLLLFLFTFLWGWKLIGGYEGNVSTLNPYVAWKYQNGKWYGFSDNADIKDKIVSNYGYFDYLNLKGVWVYNDVNFTARKKLFYHLNKGWNLLGALSGSDLSVLNTAWKYDGKWYVHGDVNGSYPKFSMLSADEGVWVYSENEDNLTLNMTRFLPFNPVGSGYEGDFPSAYSFIIGYSGCNPSWDWSEGSALEDFNDTVKEGLISFGGAGAENINLAYQCTEEELLNAYEKVLNTYPSVEWIDFDIEGGMFDETDANLKRFKVLKQLQTLYPDLKISLTLPVMPWGFDDKVKELIKEALDVNLSIYSYNLMLMDFSEDYPADDENKTLMYDYSVEAVKNVNNYLKTVLKEPLLDGEYYYKIGAVAMIGVNDIKNEIFYKSDFALLRDFALKHSMPLLSFWAVYRDSAQNSGLENYGKIAQVFYNLGSFATLNTISYLNSTDTFYWQLQGEIKDSPAKVYDIDMFDNNQSVIEGLKEKGKTVICYINAGAWEEWREDAQSFPNLAIGNALDGWSGERWLDIRDESVRELMKKRLDMAFEKGCDGIEADNVDGYKNDTGFDLTYEDQLQYNMFLAREAKKRGLLIALKNDFEQTGELAGFFDFLIAEEAVEYNETDSFLPFIIQKKPVYDIEYNDKYFNCAESYQVYLMNLELDGSTVKSCNY